MASDATPLWMTEEFLRRTAMAERDAAIRDRNEFAAAQVVKFAEDYCTQPVSKPMLSVDHFAMIRAAELRKAAPAEVCAGCGATSAEDADVKCRPDYADSCPGLDLWKSKAAPAAAGNVAQNAATCAKDAPESGKRIDRARFAASLQKLSDWIGDHWCRKDWGIEGEKLCEVMDLVEELVGPLGFKINGAVVVDEAAPAAAPADPEVKHAAAADAFNDVPAAVRGTIGPELWRMEDGKITRPPATPPADLHQLPDGGYATRLIEACANVDWMQLHLNRGGCFHVEDGRICGRAMTWAGHGVPGFHEATPLYVAITKAVREAAERAGGAS